MILKVLVNLQIVKKNGNRYWFKTPKLTPKRDKSKNKILFLTYFTIYENIEFEKCYSLPSYKNNVPYAELGSKNVSKQNAVIFTLHVSLQMKKNYR